MRITGHLPVNVARAYTAAPPQSAAPQPAPPIQSTSPTQRVDPAARLIAGHVPGGVDFRGSVPVQGASLQLYSRAADKVEAAVAVNLGRRIDISG